MKKIVFVLLSLTLTISCHAIPLFPFFVDLVGDYNDGVMPELQSLGVEGRCSDKCNDFNSIEAADMFLDDVLPYSNYPISREKVEKDGIKMELYSSPMEDGTSVMCLIEIPGKGLYVVYDELRENPK